MNYLQTRFIYRLFVNHRGFRHLQLMIDADATIRAGRQREPAEARRILITLVVLITGNECVLLVYLQVTASAKAVIDLRHDYGLIEKRRLQRRRVKNRGVDDSVTIRGRAVEVHSKRRALFLDRTRKIKVPSALLVRRASQGEWIPRVQTLITEIECGRAVIFV